MVSKFTVAVPVVVDDNVIVAAGIIAAAESLILTRTNEPRYK